MNQLRYLFLSCFFVTTSVAQKWGVNTFSQFTNEAVDVEVDAIGNSYITGYLTGETAFNTTNVVQSALGNGDIYVAKYGPTGNLIWKETFGGNYSDRAVDLAIGPDQNIVVTGQFFGSLTMGGTTLTSTSNSKDIFLVKIDPNGQVIWAKKEGGNLNENAYGVTVDMQNNVILTGQFQGTATLAGTTYTSANDPITNQPSFDFFIAKYTSNGTDLWAKNGFADYEDRGLAVTVDQQNNIFFTGQFSDTLQFSGNTFNNNGFNVGFVSKLSSSGQLIYFNQLKAGMVVPYDLEIDADEEIVVTGDFLGNLNYYDANGIHSVQNPYTKQIFILKIENNGNYIWNYTLGSNNDISARSIGIDMHKDIFVTGFFKCDLSQIQDTNHLLFNSVGFKDAYVLKVDEFGNVVYTKQFGGKLDDEGQGIALPNQDQPIVCGSYTKDLNLTTHSNSTNYNYGNSNYQLHGYGSSEPNHNYLIGDSTRNSFLLNYFSSTNYDYNFFNPAILDSIPGQIVGLNNEIDTVHFCTTTLLTYETNTYPHFGPSYHFIWNTNQTSNPISINATNTYSVIVNRFDGCGNDTDSIVAILEPTPALPLLSDTIGINTFTPAPNYHGYHFCYPDSVEITYSNLGIGDSLTTLYGPYNSPTQVIGSGIGPFTLTQGGVYYVVSQNEYCHHVDTFHINMDHVIPYDSIQLGIVMSNLNDSIQVCFGNPVHFAGIDYITNPNGIFSSLTEPYTVVNWAINNSPSQNILPVRTDFYPAASGWYTVSLNIVLGYNNLCGLDTTHYSATKQFYIDVLPLPTWNNTISGDNLLCPNGSVFLVASNPNPQLHWSGPGIIWNNFNDSIEVNAPGTYHYQGTVIGANGCSNHFSSSFYITLKTAPHITSQPTDAIICPYDSVYMNIATTYMNYQWIGPSGDSLSNTFDCYGEDIGFYYVHVTDMEGCHLTSPPFELNEYATPSISVLPDQFLCQGETVDLIVSYSGEPVFSWSPINSTNDEVTVSQAGVYTVSITQCGFTISDSIEIIDGSFTASIATLDSVLCYNEEAVIIGSPGNLSYEWNNGQLSSGTYVVDDGGTYFALVSNEYGCTYTTNSIQITEVPGSIPPEIPSTTVCPGQNVSLQDQTNFTLNWYDVDTNLVLTSNSLHLNNLVSDTGFLVAYAIPACGPVYSTVNITIIDSIPLYTILGDSIFCPNENGLFSVNSTNETLLWSIGGTPLTSTNPLSINYQTLNQLPVLTLSISNQCFSTSITDTLIYLHPLPISLSTDSLVLCSGDEVTVDLTGDIQTATWNSVFGTQIGPSLTLDYFFGTGNLSVSAIDINGCQTDTLNLFVTSSTFNFSIQSNLGNLCLGDSGSLEIVGSGIDSLLWSTPFGQFDTTSLTVVYTPSNEAWYGISMWDTLGCHYTDSIELSFNELPIFDLGTDTILCINDTYTYLFPSDSNTYVWTTYGNSTTIPILSNQDLILTATSPDGCTFSDTLVVVSVDCSDELPNVITPNNDGINDFLFIDDALALKNNKLILINRWGNKVFEAAHYQNDFGGENLSEGTYFYVFYKDVNDESKGKIEGFITILR